MHDLHTLLHWSDQSWGASRQKWWGEWSLSTAKQRIPAKSSSVRSKISRLLLSLWVFIWIYASLLISFILRGSETTLFVDWFYFDQARYFSIPPVREHNPLKQPKGWWSSCIVPTQHLLTLAKSRSTARCILTSNSIQGIATGKTVSVRTKQRLSTRNQGWMLFLSWGTFFSKEIALNFTSFLRLVTGYSCLRWCWRRSERKMPRWNSSHHSRLPHAIAQGQALKARRASLRAHAQWLR